MKLLSAIVVSALLLSAIPASAQVASARITGRAQGATPIAKWFGVDYTVLTIKSGIKLIPVFCFNNLAAVCFGLARGQIIDTGLTVDADFNPTLGRAEVSMTVLTLTKL